MFSYNKTLLNYSLENLRQLKNIRLRYLQIDSKHKCVPTDWYLGYDTFAIYTFYQLTGNKGYLKSLMKENIVDF